MIFNNPQQLTELVRLLQMRGHVFVTDPQPITLVLRHDSTPVEKRLLRRAELIDGDQALRLCLQRIQAHMRLLLWLVSVLLFVGGFGTTMALMTSSNINFFYVFISVLGLNTVMLLLWLVLILMPKYSPVSLSYSPLWWFRGQDAITQAVMHMYADKAKSPTARWCASKISHQLWLCTLGGIWLALWLLLLVRQYGFNWESTLLSTETLVSLVSVLSWLPEQLGFAVPQAQTVADSRFVTDDASARLWGGLLVGSVFCYGLLPRLLAWLLCWLLLQRQSERLPLEHPYYQHIIQQWQQKIVDADTEMDSMATSVRPPPLQLSDACKWAAMLDAPWPDTHWYRHVLGQDWLNQGVIADRATQATLLAALQTQAVQLLLGVRVRSVPDRGLLRQLDALMHAAQGGLIVQLLASAAEIQEGTQLNDHLAQWHKALQIRQITWLDPAAYAQQHVESNSPDIHP